MNKYKLLLYIIATIGISGCATTAKNPIELLSKYNLENNNENNLFDYKTYSKNYTQYVLDNKVEEAKAERRKQVFLLINYIDLYYDRHIKANLINGKAWGEVTYDTLLIALSSVASFAGGNTPSVLAAISTGIQGTKNSLDENLFQDSSPIILALKMDQLRSEALLHIRTRLFEETTSYPLEEAMRDVISYYSAGTLKSATIATIQEAGAKKQEFEKEIQNLNKQEKSILKPEYWIRG